MPLRIPCAALLLIGLAACSTTEPDAPPGVADRAGQAGAEAAPAPGSDRDAHGCIPSAGYAWCGSTRQCERPWELAKAKGFDNSPEDFDRFCRNEGGQAGGTG